jgi:hypothetical protein
MFKVTQSQCDTMFPPYAEAFALRVRGRVRRLWPHLRDMPAADLNARLVELACRARDYRLHDDRAVLRLLNLERHFGRGFAKHPRGEEMHAILCDGPDPDTAFARIRAVLAAD